MQRNASTYICQLILHHHPTITATTLPFHLKYRPATPFYYLFVPFQHPIFASSFFLFFGYVAHLRLSYRQPTPPRAPFLGGQVRFLGSLHSLKNVSFGANPLALKAGKRLLLA
jgi:hypothetical protein